MLKQKTKFFDINNERAVLIDTNVLIFIFFPITVNDNHIASKYLKVFFDICNNKIKIILSDIQISELLNTLTRRSYKMYIKSNPYLSYKEYRNTADYATSLQDIEAFVLSKLLPISVIDNYTSSCGDLSCFFKQSKLDYNDLYFINLALKHSGSIITHDTDFFACAKVRVFSEVK